MLGPNMRIGARSLTLAVALTLLLAACAAPSPTATPSTAPIAAPTPTKAPTATPTKRPLVKATLALPSNSLINANIILGVPTSFYREEGLDLELVVGGGAARVQAAVSSGSAQFGPATFGDPIVAISQGAPMKVIGLTNIKTTVLVTMRKDVAERLGISQKSPIAERGKAMKGLILSPVSAGGGTIAIARLMLQLGGWDPERDATISVISDDAAAIAALRQGTVDVIIRGPPSTVVPLVESYGVLIFNASQEDLPGLPHPATAIIAHNDSITRQPDVAEGFLRAAIRSARMIQQDRPGATKALRTMDLYQEMQEAVLQRTLDLVLPAAVEQPSVPKSAFDEALAFANADRPANEQIKATFEQVVDNRYAEAAKKLLGF